MPRRPRVLSLLSACLLLASVAADAGTEHPTLAPEVASDRETAAALGIYAAPGPRVISPRLAARMERAPQREVTVWVFFTDKGIGTRGSLDAALHRFRDALPADARARRALVSPDLAVDFDDLPVHDDYLAALEQSGARILTASRWLNAAAVTHRAADLGAVARFPFVRYLQPVRRHDAPPLPTVVAPWNPPRGLQMAATPTAVESWFYGPSLSQLDQIGVLDLHRLGYTGAGVKVMMIDTGFRTSHPTFQCASVAWEYDFINDDATVENEPGDHFFQHNHGTGVWGVSGGYTPGTLIGPAFGADFYLAKTEDITSETQAEEQNYVEALEQADLMGVEVTSASLNYWFFDDSTGYGPGDMDGDTGVITVAVDIAVSKGIACVNSIGNSGAADTTLGTPSDADSIIAVGAVDSLGTIAGFSSRGPTTDGRIKPEVVARGVLTTWATPSSYGQANGTSLSTPLVCGLAALLKEAHPTWTGYQIREALIATASQSGAPDNTRGYGLVDGVAALGYGGPPEPPRATLPFALLTPNDGATVGTLAPTLRWAASVAVAPGDAANYVLYLSTSPDFTSGVTAYPTGTDTCWIPPSALTPGTPYTWRVEATGLQAVVRKSQDTRSFSVSEGLDAGPTPVPPVGLLGATPNPFASSTTLRYHLPKGELGVLRVLSITGRQVREIPVTGTDAEAVITWDGRDMRGRRVGAGIYLYRLIAPSGAWSRKLTVLSGG